MDAGKTFRNGLLWSGVIIGLMLVLAAYAWVKLPAGMPIPIHWGLDGQPDNYAGKTLGLLSLPLTGVFLTLVYCLIMRIEPRQHNMRLSARAITIIWVSGMGLLAVTQGFIVVTALGKQVDVTMLTTVVCGVLFITIGNYLGKIRSNYFAGIRTPWTLSSDLAWDKTHRFGGKLFMLLGVLFLLTIYFHDQYLFFVLLASEMVLVVVMLSIYSYFVWRTDVNRRNSDVAEQQQAAPPAQSDVPRVTAVITVVLVLVLAVAGVLVSRWVRTPVSVQGQARQMITAASRGDFVAAEQDFDGTMHTAMTPAAFQQIIWKDLIDKYGTFQRVSGMHTSSSWPYTLVYTTVRFAHASVTMRVVFSRSGQISGLWLVNVTPVEGH